MRITVILDHDVYEAAVCLARDSGRSLGKVLSELARRGLQREKPAAKGRRRIPTFQVPPDASVILASRVQGVLDEEG